VNVPDQSVLLIGCFLLMSAGALDDVAAHLERPKATHVSLLAAAFAARVWKVARILAPLEVSSQSTWLPIQRGRSNPN
jgi:hypothetical protein